MSQRFSSIYRTSLIRLITSVELIIPKPLPSPAQEKSSRRKQQATMQATISYLAAAGSPPPPLSFSKLSTSSSSPRSTLASSRITRILRQPIRASASGAQRRTTLSEGWSPSGLSTGPAWFPRFEELDTTNMLLKQRIVFLGSQVDTVTADLIISQLLLLDAEDQEKDIKLFINSPGGSVTSGMGIYDAMKLCKADVSTVCMGLAASMGAFLLAAGTKGKRYCMPNARVMIHQPLGTAGGKTTDMGLQIREMMYHKVKINKIFSRITGKPEQQIEIDTDRDNFMNPWEAKEYGLVDAIIDDGKPGLVAPIADSTPPPKTRVWDYWKIEGSKKAKKNLPSELKISQNGLNGISESDDKEKGSDHAKEAQTPV